MRGAGIVRVLPLLAAIAILGCNLQTVGNALWGQQYNRIMLPGASMTWQMVRLRLDMPTDLTLYLQGTQTDGALLPGAFTVAAAAGGTSLINRAVIAPAVGVALHYVTDQVQVDGLFTPQGLEALGTSVKQVRGSAAVGIGRPVLQYEHGQVLANATFNAGTELWTLPSNDPWGAPPGAGNWNGIASGKMMRVPPFAVRYSVAIRDLARTGDPPLPTSQAHIRVYELAASSSSKAFPVAFAYAPALLNLGFQPLDPTTTFIGVVNEDGNDTRNVQIIFEVLK